MGPFIFLSVNSPPPLGFLLAHFVLLSLSLQGYQLPTMVPEMPHLRRNGSSRKIIPANTTIDSDEHKTSPLRSLQSSKANKATTILRSIISFLPLRPFLPSCKWTARISTFSSSSSPFNRPPSLGKRVTATIYGHRRGHVNFVVQAEPGSGPALVLELAMPTSSLVKEMASGLVRLALECERGARKVLFGEPFWTMYCNGRKTGYAVSRQCSQFDQKVLGLLRAVSIGAGVLPLLNGEGGEVMYMRARFERVVGSCDSEAFYMMNPDGSGGPEFSIFLIRI